MCAECPELVEELRWRVEDSRVFTPQANKVTNPARPSATPPQERAPHEKLASVNENREIASNLLLGILAYQNSFITREAFFAAMQAWLYDKAKSLAQILQNQGALDPDRRALLEALVRQHVKQNDDDPHRACRPLARSSRWTLSCRQWLIQPSRLPSSL